MHSGQPEHIRKASVAGSFYSGNKAQLTKQLEDHFSEAHALKTNSGQLQAIISPHAGYMFSGKVAASAFNQIPKKATFKRVFVLASSHQFLFNGAAVYCSGNYETPLGEINVDVALGKKLVESSTLFSNYEEAHLNEHSLEVELPFLQYKLGSDFTLIPIILGTNEPKHCKEIANKLEPYFTPENLFVVSTDFSHYPEYNTAYKTDERTAEAICHNDPEFLLKTIEKIKKEKIKNLATSLCGWTSVLTLLYLTEKKDLEYSKIHYQNSGDAKIYGDKDRVVGYWAMAVYNSSHNFSVSKEEKEIILKKARRAIELHVKNGLSGDTDDSDLVGILNDEIGCFVSVYIEGKLRGCIGGFAQEKTLNELVQRMAVSASCDRRFDSISVEELDKMELEISVLSPLQKIKNIDEIEMGKHGIYIQEGFNTGTFLPQVATKTGWNKKQFLGHCAKDKAGIGWNGWKTAEIFIYEAIIFRNS